jgi:hypothetical protein
LVFGRLHPFLTGFRWLGAALWLVCPSCSATSDAVGTDAGSVGFCASLVVSSSGVAVANCNRPTTTLHDVHFTPTGVMESFAFTVTCGNNAARGTWDTTSGLQCAEGTFSCDGGPCTPMSSMDCRLEPNCEQQGQCEYQDGQCVLTDDGCAHSEISCGVNGACHLGPAGTCVVLSDADCQMPFGSCVSCEFKGACLAEGKCYAENGACVAKNDADCRAAQQCRFAGKCSVVGDVCGAASDMDCAGSDVCTMAGQCTARDGHCSAF